MQEAADDDDWVGNEISEQDIRPMQAGEPPSVLLLQRLVYPDDASRGGC